MIRRNIKYFFPANTLDIEMVSQPAKEHKSGPWDSCDSKEYELWVMLCAFTDPAIREGELMFIVLRYPIDDEYYNGDCYCWKLEKDCGGELAFEGLH